MTHLTVLEWGRVDVGEGGFSRREADQLLAAARSHPLGATSEGANILIDHNRWLRSQQVVGVLAGEGCSLEILPKIDQLGEDKSPAGLAGLRHRLVQMLDVALGLEMNLGREAAMARQNETLLDILIRAFADQLANEVRRGLPRQYIQCEEDLSTLRGRLDVTRQFTKLAVRPDRLACRFDALSPDTALLQVMKACVVFLSRQARRADTVHRLSELRAALADTSDVQPHRLPWDKIAIDRSNRRWRSLLALARLFLRRDWQATHRANDPRDLAGMTLLFPMNDLFEAYVAALLRKALTPEGYEVVSQGGLRHCLNELAPDGTLGGPLFRTKPDCMVRRDGRTVLVIDTKWKRLTSAGSDPKRGVSQADVYQMMAYARLYETERLMLFYPHHAGLDRQGALARHRINGAGADDRLTIASIDVAADPLATISSLKALALAEVLVAA
jgi:5-methylcytosine-specific restriction enzyme subunit McrC